MIYLYTHLIDRLQTSIIFESLERGPITLPKELEPGRHERTIGAILALVAADRPQQDTLWGFASLQIIDIDGRLDGSLLLRFANLGVGELDKFGDDRLDALDAGILSDVFVLHETFLCGTAFAHVYAKFDEAVHDGLKRREGGRSESF